MTLSEANFKCALKELATFRGGRAGVQGQSEEFGDLLFTLANIARRMDIDLESSLREANHRFYRRFTRMEELARERGLDLSKLPLSEQDKLWEEAKGEER